jgi:hypothetical protein
VYENKKADECRDFVMKEKSRERERKVHLMAEVSCYEREIILKHF